MARSVHPVAETGNGFIDSTHAALLRRIGDIRAQCAQGAPREAVVRDFDAFIGEMTAHFGHEEMILRAVGYHHWEEHAEQHEALGQQVERLVGYLRECDVSRDFLSTVAGTLDAVLSQHEIMQDGVYADLLRTMGRPRPGEPLIAWTADFDIGVEPVDAQHRELVGLVNELHRMSGGDYAGEDALTLLERLRVHVVAHFEDEERLLRAISPTRCLNHAASHDAMEAQFLAVVGQVASGEVELAVAVRDFLRFWLMDHILVCDRRHFSSMGLPTPLKAVA